MFEFDVAVCFDIRSIEVKTCSPADQDRNMQPAQIQELAC